MNKGFNGLLLNYLKVGLRSLNRYRNYSIINLLGLVIGLSSVVSITIYIHGEMSVDRHHLKGENIYRLNARYTRPNRVTQYPLIPPAIAPTAQSNFPEIEQIARLRYAYDVLMHDGDKSFYEDKVFFAEPDFLKMFSFKRIHGDPITALEEPNSLIMTQSMATKYFGNNDPIGQSIIYNDDLTLNVAAVIADPLDNTHFKFDFLISFSTYKPGEGSLADLTSWRWLGFITYVQLKKYSDINLLEGKLSDMFVSNRPPNPTSEARLDLQPLYDIYLKSSEIANPQGGLFRINSYDNLVSLGVIAVLIIIIAFFNYLNIVTALMRTRTKEIGVRKVFGTSKIKIVGQLMTETFVLMGLSSAISFLVLIIVNLLGYLAEINLASIILTFSLTLILGIVFSIITGFYLGAVLSGYSAIALLQNKLGVKSSKLSFRHVVLFTQYAISASLIGISLIVIAQIKYFSTRELGYEKEGVLTLPFRGSNASTDIEPLRNELKNNSVVQSVTFGPPMDGSTGGSPLRLKEWPEGQNIQTAYLGVDFEFTSFMNLTLKDGRFFDPEIHTDSSSALIINETLAKSLELENPIGAEVVFAGGQEYRIIGVFADFHYQSLHHEIGPMGLMINFVETRNMMIRFRSDNVQSAISAIEDSWQKVFANNEYPFQYVFLDDQLATLYQTEKEFSRLIQLFTGLAIFIALLGLYGLSSITIYLKLKQISIRRVLGAQIGDVGKVIGMNFLLIAFLASLVSWPVVYYVMEQWLNDFAYKIDLGVTFLFQMLALVLVVTLVTLAIQMKRVLTTNPVTILKSE
ncbi:MAG: ABC transporter permease [Ekhidna sp.]